jgi:acyl-CoA dehydrogenase
MTMAAVAKSSVSVEEILQAVKGVKKTVPRKYMRECQISGDFPHKLFEAVRDSGLLGLGVPEEYGGMGGGVTEVVALTEALNREGIGLVYMVLAGMVRATLAKYGNGAQKEKYLLPATSGEKKVCFAITEPNAGTNTLKIESVARRSGNVYKLNGQKTFITGWDEADFCLLVARTTPYKEAANKADGISLFILDTKAKGVTATPLRLLSNMPEHQFTLYFDDVEIPAEDLIGQEGKGLKQMFSALNPERLVVSAQALGMGYFVLNKAIEYAKVRAPFDAPIGAYQSTQHPLAYAYAHLEASREIMYKACRLHDEGKDCGAEANMAKLLTSDAADEAIGIAMQVHGGSCLDAETDLVTFLPTMKMQKIGPVSNQMILNFIGQHVLGLPKSY